VSWLGDLNAKCICLCGVQKAFVVFNVHFLNKLFNHMWSSCNLQTIYLYIGSLFCLLRSDLPTTMPPTKLLVLTESPQWVWVGALSWFQNLQWKNYWILLKFFIKSSLKKKRHSCVLLVFLQSSQWVDFIEVFLWSYNDRIIEYFLNFSLKVH